MAFDGYLAKAYPPLVPASWTYKTQRHSMTAATRMALMASWSDSPLPADFFLIIVYVIERGRLPKETLKERANWKHD